jgi:ribonuclease Z
LNQLDTRIFTIPKFSLQPAKDIFGISSLTLLFYLLIVNVSAIQNLPPSVQPMVGNQTVSMHPFKPPVIETPVQDKFHPAMKVNEPVNLPQWTARKFRTVKKGVASALNRSRSRSTGSGSESDCTPSLRRGRDVGVLPLGTGSAAPSKYRNGTFVRSSALCNVIDPNFSSL